MRPTIATLACLALAWPGLSSAQARAGEDTLARIDSVFAQVGGRDAPGCAVGAKQDGLPAIARAYGMASLEYGVPNTPTTRFYAASVGKQFTAAAIVLLAQENRLSLDDDVRKYVPELPSYGAPITLRQLMNHMSGLRDQWELLWLAGGRDDDPTEDEDLLAMIVRQRALNFEPGAQHLYSNTGYTLLALVVQRVTGTSLKEYAGRHIFEPAGMSKTLFRDSRFQVLQETASGYRMVQGGRWGAVAYLYDVYGPGGLFTSIEDLLRWYEELPSGKVAGGALWRAAMERGRLANGDSVPYSMGLDVGRYASARYVGHGGNDMGASAYAMRFVDRGLSVAVLCNGREIDAFTLARRTAAVFLGPTPSAAGPSSAVVLPTITLDAAQLERYVGLYYNPITLATRRVDVRDGRLVWARGPGTPLDAVAENRFRFPPGRRSCCFPPRRLVSRNRCISCRAARRPSITAPRRSCQPRVD